MGYLPDFIEDVFISYAHNDDDAYAMEPQGWVAQLDEDLRKRVAVYLDGRKPSVWRDRDVRSNEDFAEKITGRLVTAATFLSIISPSFFQRPWCLREIEEFAASAEQNLGVRIGEKNRIFKVEKVPLSFDRSNLPGPLQGAGSYKFYGPDPEHEGKIHEYRPKLGMDYAKRYFVQIDDLAQDIAMVLKQMYAKSNAQGMPNAETQPTIYLAETTGDLEDFAKEIRRDLKARGCIVLPEGDLPYRTRDLKTRVMQDLQASMFSIHMVGSEYGFVPEGEQEKSSAWLQNDYAIEHQKGSPGFMRILWMVPDVAASDGRQENFIKYLHHDSASQMGADLIESKLEDLKTIVQEKVRSLREKREKKTVAVAAAPVPAAAVAVTGTAAQAQADDPLRIYVICDQADLGAKGLHELRSYLFSQGYECILPTADADEREALQEHADNLEICDACIIYYGQGPERWFNTKLRELRKLLSGRAQPVRAKAVYVAPPDGPGKAELQTLEAIVLRGTEEFSGAPLSPFLNRLRPAAGA